MVRELADRVYLETGFEGGNVGAILTERGALLVDAPMLPPEARAWRATVASLDGGKVWLSADAANARQLFEEEDGSPVEHD